MQVTGSSREGDTFAGTRAPMVYLHVKELLESLAEHAAKRRFVYFIASPDETGQSWCPDCRRVQPFVDEARTKLPENAMWFDVHTGDRPAIIDLRKKR